MPRAATKSDPIAYAPLGLSAPDAARFLGIGETLFLELVGEGRMPRPRIVKSRRVWDAREITAAFSDLPHDEDRPKGNSIDREMGIGQ